MKSNVIYAHYPMSHNMILDINEVFLQPGVHHIHTNDAARFREYVDTFLHAFDYYHHIGYIATQKTSSSLYHDLTDTFAYTQESAHVATYMASEFIYDFVWIERNNLNENVDRYIDTFLDGIEQYGIADTMPIIIFTEH